MRRVSAFKVGLLTILVGAIVFFVLALANPPDCTGVENYDGPCLDEGGVWLLSFVVTIPAGILAGCSVALWRKLGKRSER